MKFKRILSVLLTLSLLMSCICIFASAESEAYTGVYNGYNYYTSTAVTKTSMEAYLSYADSSATLKIRCAYVYKDTNGDSQNDAFTVTEKNSVLGQKVPYNISEYVSLTATYFINGTNIQRVHVGV